MFKSSQSHGVWNRLKSGIFCGLLAVTMVACDSSEDTGDFDDATLNQLTDIGAAVGAVNVDVMASVYQAALANQGTQPAPKDDFQFACSQTGGGSASGTFNFDGTSATWAFSVLLSNCNGVNGSLFTDGFSIPGQSLGLESIFSGQTSYDGCSVGMGNFQMTLGDITLSDPPTASTVLWDGFLNVTCENQDLLGCEFFDDPAATSSQIRAAVIERCAFFDETDL